MAIESAIQTIGKHPGIWKAAHVVSVVLKRKDPNEQVEQWYNYFTKVILVPNSETSCLEEPLTREDFRIIRAKMSLEEILTSLKDIPRSEFFQIGPYKVGRLVEPTSEEFLSSDQAGNKFQLNFSCTFWKMDSKTHYGFNDRELEPERESLPFRSINDALIYYVGMPQDTSSYQHAFCLLAPYYYAKLDNCLLKDAKLHCMIVENLCSLSDLVLRYNYEDKSGQIAGGSRQVERPNEIIELEFSPRKASIWLYHKNGFKIDERRYLYRTLTTDELFVELSTANIASLRDEIQQSIIESIEHISKNIEFATLVEKTTEGCVDSLDVEILRTIKEFGREYHDFMPRILKWCGSARLIEHLGKLVALDCLELDENGRTAITSLGLDLLSLPPAIFVARTPAEVAIRIADISRVFRQGDFEGVITSSTRLLEHILRVELTKRFGEGLQKKWKGLGLKPYDRVGLGELKNACTRLKIFDEGEFENKIVEAFLRIRTPISHEKALKPDSVSSARIALDLVECFARYWYYVRVHSAE